MRHITPEIQERKSPVFPLKNILILKI